MKLDKKFLINNSPSTLPPSKASDRFQYYILALLASAALSMRFLFQYSDCYYGLEDGSAMKSFSELMYGKMNWFSILSLIMILVIVMNYLSFFRGSRSIYLMRRLSNPWELHRRCILLPAVGIVISQVTRLILILFYFAIYMLVTPDGYLPPDSWQKLWSVLV